LVALNGSFLVVGGNPKDLPDKPAQVNLKKMTILANDHLIWLQACKEESRVKGLVSTQITSPENCVFATETNKALIHLDDVDTDEQMRRYFSWAGGFHNAFLGYQVLVEQQPRKDEIAPEPYNKSRWETWTNEVNSFFGRPRFSVPQAPERPLTRAVPVHFKVSDKEWADWQKSNKPEAGADLDALPKPFGEEGTNP
jgi:hypothetical protein